MSKAHFFLILIAVNLLLIVAMFVHAAIEQDRHGSVLRDNISMVRNLELTDLCLFTEARYTRHLSQSDIHSALQDHPVSLEHFPAGSLAGPPVGLRRIYAKPD